MSGTEAYAPQKRYVEKQKAEGFTAVTVWVPEKAREQTIEYAANLRRSSQRHKEAQL